MEQAGEEVPDKAPPERQKQSGRVGGMEPGSRLLCPWDFLRKKRVVICSGYKSASGKSTMRNTLGHYGKAFKKQIE